MTIEIKNKMKLRRKPLSCSFVSQHYLITGTETHLGAVKGGKGEVGMEVRGLIIAGVHLVGGSERKERGSLGWKY